MTSNYEMWITYDAEAEKLQIPVLPDNIQITNDSGNESVNIVDLGELTVKGGRKEIAVQFSSFFPAQMCQAVSSPTLLKPWEYVNKLLEWKNGPKPVHLILTGTELNMFATIEQFPHEEKGGDPGTLHYSMKFKEYREVAMRQITVKEKVATVDNGSTRTDNSVTPQTYTVVSGDCLWNIAKKYYGNGSKYTVIYEANKSVIGSNPNRIYPGQVLTIPAAA